LLEKTPDVVSALQVVEQGLHRYARSCEAGDAVHDVRVRGYYWLHDLILPRTDCPQPVRLLTGSRPGLYVRPRRYAVRALADAWRVLTDPQVPGATKRQILGTVVQQVVCGKEGAKVYFVPGLFGETCTNQTGDEANSEAIRLTH
jgi:hypothetical protein